MKKILVVFGTRPEAIKMCPIVNRMKENRCFDVKVLSTGQHREMLKQTMKVFDVIPDFELDIMQQQQTLSMITTNIISQMDELFLNEKFDLVLVHGDTTTAFAVALSAFYKNISVGHVEAGLRTYNIRSPFPEEFNRQAIDRISDLLFAPTDWTKQNLLKEGISENKVFVTGNTVIDALQTTIKSDYKHPELMWAEGSKLLLLTAHRRENIGEPMKNMFRAIKRICEEHSDVKVIYPIHMNPAVRKIAYEILEGCKTIHLIEPLDVFDFHNFMGRSYLIVTDSGGIQEEAPSFNVPVLVMRENTERPEGLAAGTLKLIGTTENSVYEGISKLLTDSEEYDKMCQAENPYGDGCASERIVKIVGEICGNQ